MVVCAFDLYIFATSCDSFVVPISNLPGKRLNPKRPYSEAVRKVDDAILRLECKHVHNSSCFITANEQQRVLELRLLRCAFCESDAFWMVWPWKRELEPPMAACRWQCEGELRGWNVQAQTMQ